MLDPDTTFDLFAMIQIDRNMAAQLTTKPFPFGIHYSILILSVVTISLLHGSNYSSIYATLSETKEVSDEQASADGYEIILYCGESLLANSFDQSYPSYCDESMVYFNGYCDERAFYSRDHVCTDENAVYIIDSYIEARNLVGFTSSTYVVLR